MSKIKLYFDYFKSKFKRSKEGREEKIDLDEIKEEIWSADFSNPKEARFVEKAGSDNEALVDDSGDLLSNPNALEKAFFETQNGQASFALELKRKSLYSWAMNPVFRYENFVLDAEIEFSENKNSNQNENEHSVEPTKAGTCAAGFLFRYISQKAFYSILISDKGWVRLDAVVNNTPMPILGWTKPLTETDLEKYKIKLICVGTSITVLVNNSWLGKFESDVVQAAGKIAFAGQNWESRSSVKFNLNSFKISSIPALVEEADSAANDEDGIAPEAYVNLANTYYGMGQFVAAIYCLKQAWKLRDADLQDHILAGQIYSAQGLVDEAEKEFRLALEIENDNITAQTELARLFYQTDKMKELKILLKEISDKKIEESSLLLTLQAHLLSAEGEHLQAAKIYGQAFELNQRAGVRTGILKYNEAKELKVADQKKEAVSAYIDAGNLFLAKEEYNEMANVINALEHLDENNNELWALRGKFYYAIENKSEALKDFEKLIEAKTKDASIWYLYGLLVQDEDLDAAIKAYKKACKIEPNYGLYAFRLAEALYLNDDDCSGVLAQAEAADPENGWIHNLKGLCALDEDNFEEAEAELSKARKLLPDEIIVLENYIEVKRLQGKLHECKPLFEIENGTADLAVEKNRGGGFHIFANALFFNEEYDEADVWFQKALKLKPFSPELLADKAENSLKIGYLNDADTLLVKALDIEPSERIYRLISLVAIEKGDYNRAEIVLQKAIEEFGFDEDILFDIANLYIQTNKIDKAKVVLKKLKDCENQELLKEFKKRLK